jgi:hypothetical protein
MTRTDRALAFAWVALGRWWFGFCRKVWQPRWICIAAGESVIRMTRALERGEP